MDIFVTSVLFFLPAGIANMTPILASRTPIIKHWNTPLDMGKSRRGRRILGDNKTWRGLLFGTLMGGVTGYILSPLLTGFDEHNLFIVGCVLGLGALVGDAVESYLKRQRNIAPGTSWFPFDQLDYVIGGLVFVSPLILLDGKEIMAIIVAYFGLHVAVSYIGFLMGLKPKPI